MHIVEIKEEVEDLNAAVIHNFEEHIEEFSMQWNNKKSYTSHPLSLLHFHLCSKTNQLCRHHSLLIPLLSISFVKIIGQSFKTVLN